MNYLIYNIIGFKESIDCDNLNCNNQIIPAIKNELPSTF